MLELLSELTRELTRIDSESWTILLVMVGWAALLIQLSVDSKSYTAVFIPGMILGGLIAFYVARVNLITLASTKDINAIMLSVIGIVGGFAASLMVISLIRRIADSRKAITVESRV